MCVRMQAFTVADPLISDPILTVPLSSWSQDDLIVGTNVDSSKQGEAEEGPLEQRQPEVEEDGGDDDDDDDEYYDDGHGEEEVEDDGLDDEELGDRPPREVGPSFCQTCFLCVGNH